MTVSSAKFTSGATISWQAAETAPQMPRTMIQQLAWLFLKGTGIEIGALHNPLLLPAGARARYVDRMAVKELRKQYPELGALPLVEADILDDGERLGTIGDGSCDFVIASHFLEHAQNPIGAVEHMLRVLKVGGVVLLALPDKRFTFDRDRPVTAFEHVLRDYKEGPSWSRMGHFEEWVRYVDKVTEAGAFEAKVKERVAMDYSVHCHVWTNGGMVEMFSRMQTELGFAFEIAAMMADYGTVQVIFVLRKLAAG